MATVTVIRCDICGSEKGVTEGVSVPVLHDSTASEYGIKKTGRKRIDMAKLDLCDKCLRKVTKVHAIPRWYQSDKYEIMGEETE